MKPGRVEPMRFSSKPAEAVRVDARRKRAGGQARGHRGIVVTGRSDVIRSIGMKQGRQVLDLATSLADLPLATAIHLDPAAFAVVVGVEQGTNAAEPGGLDVDRLRRYLQCLDIGDRMDRCIP